MRLRSIFIVAAALTLSTPVLAGEAFLAGETFMLSAGPINGKVHFSTAVYPEVLIHNAGEAIAFVGCGDEKIKANLPPIGVPVAGTMDATPIPPHTSMLLYKGGATDCAAITTGVSTTLYLTTGQSVPASKN